MASLRSYARSSSSLSKRIRLDPGLPLAPWTTARSVGPAQAHGTRSISTTQRLVAESQPLEASDSASRQLSKSEMRELLDRGIEEPRLPRSVQAAYLRPLRRKAEYGVPACDLQLRSYHARNLELMCDFALRTAYYLGLPAAGPVPLPRMIERWTVSRSVFVHKKSQENFERITMRRLIQIQDGDPEIVQRWLAFVRKHAYYAVGMKANVWEHEKLGVGKEMDVKLENLKQITDPKWAHFGRRKNPQTAEQVMELMKSQELRRIDDGPMQDRS